MELTPRYDGTPIISIEGAADDQCAPLVRQRRRMETMLAGLTDDDWATPSRCDGWTVQDVIAHLVSVNNFWQLSVSAGLAGTPTQILNGFDPAATPPLLVEPLRALTPAETLEQFVTSNDGFLGVIDGLDDSAWSTLAEAPAGHLPIRLLAHHALWDSWVHERDIALPLGTTPALEADEVGSCLRFAAALSPAFAINFGKPLDGTFWVEAKDPTVCFALEISESVAVREGPAPGDAPCLRGAAEELVEALSLRTALPASAPAEWQQLLDGLSDAFDANA